MIMSPPHPPSVRRGLTQTEVIALVLFGGVVLNGQLRIEDSSGRLLREDDRDPAPLFGATFIARF